jgi:predicted nuclease of predicted toxin-antitoxin system
MLQLATDENFNGDIVRGLLFRLPDVNLVRVQDVGLEGAIDPVVLAWAAQNQRIVVTHDRATLPAFAFERVVAGEPMPGVFIINDRLPVGRAIEELVLVTTCSEASEWEGRVLYLPL